MDKYIGRLLDNRYEILEVIGSGGMAVVYKARCHRLNRLVAIKILKDDYLEDEDFRRRFHAESQAVAMLSHPNIVSVYDVSTSISMEADYIVMELIEGITLKQYMEKKGVLNWKETLHFAMQIAKALEHAHSRGVVHRDIKPHNVMVLKNGSVKVADFGIARLMSKGDTLTKEALGSVHYISPEQAKGGRVDNRSDIYSLGVVMYEMMSGRPPYEGESPVSVAIQHINGGAIMPSTLNPNIPGGMEQIIMKAMSHELKDRYATATQMLSDMDEFRKNPALLFDYNTPPLDEVTKLNHSTLVLNQNTVKSTADKVEEKAEAHRNKRQTEKAAAAAAAAAAARKREYAADGRGSRVATAAIIACSLVAIIAIVVFLVIFFNGLGSSETVTVPSFVGKYFDALPQSSDYVIKEFDYRQFSEEFEEGQIIRQTPVGGSKIAKGETVHVLVSKGKQTEPILMPGLEGQTEATARHQLDQLGLELDVTIEEEYNDKIAVGKVIRTEPASGKELADGQKVTLILSLGKEPEETDPAVDKKVPGVVGLPLTDALSALTTAGFTNVEPESVYSDKDPGIVLNQSVEKDKVVKTDTLIRLEVSMGPDPNATEPPTEPDPTDPPSTDPDPTDPPSTEPDPTDPPPTDPEPTNPDVIDPAV
ncbi:MAG: Stk1 family PASTA domain-containing Ser/Thr kinase [Oscillospiraceae bacterium]|nr:Stk1 family PASTA domain-containing Ser/Thr kinase [Oscillospiraceae bacterium]